MVKVAAIVKTNLPAKSIQKEFLNKLSDALAKQFYTEVEHVCVEVLTEIQMVKGGSSAPMATVQLYHNDDRVDNDTKHGYAKNIAQFLSHQIRVPEDRVLVLFHDTRKCT